MVNPTKGSDMFELKLRKKLLAQQLSVLDAKASKVSNFITTRKTNAGLPDPFKTVPTQQIPHRKKYIDRNKPDALPQPLLQPEPIQPGSNFDHVRKRNLLRHQKAIIERIPKKASKPIKCDPYKINTDVPQSMLPRRYTRGELPCSVEHRSSGLALSWMCPLANLDYSHYLPIFMDGIRCKENPYKFIARRGIYELFEDARGNSERILENVDGFIPAIRHALSTKCPDTVNSVIGILKQLCTVHPMCGPALVPHYRQILGILNLFYCKGGKNLGDQMDYGQYKSDDLVVSIAEVLELFEVTGGENAFANIKFMVPTYTSCFIDL